MVALIGGLLVYDFTISIPSPAVLVYIIIRDVYNHRGHRLIDALATLRMQIISHGGLVTLTVEKGSTKMEREEESKRWAPQVSFGSRVPREASHSYLIA